MTINSNSHPEKVPINVLDIFLDESGKKSSEVSLIGAVSIPDILYADNTTTDESIGQLNRLLKSNSLGFHFTRYTPNDFKKYKALIETISKVPNVIHINVVTFKRQQLKAHPLLSNSDMENMIYSKVPEQVIYGLLRNYSNLEPLKAHIYIENSSEYESRRIAEKVKEQLNIHSLYRFDNFMVSKSILTPKNTQIGLEFTDTILGIIRIIIRSIPLQSHSMHEHSKLVFIAQMMPKLEQIFKNVRIFELAEQDHLTEIDFSIYLSLFQANLSVLDLEP
ncbi:MAG TPA: hypothetical protein DCW31_10970 [Lactobacillus sp.]|nr:hypothetical protein [Lactobacillus sp.]